MNTGISIRTPTCSNNSMNTSPLHAQCPEAKQAHTVLDGGK